MAKISEILSEEELNTLKETKSRDEIIAIARQRYKESNPQPSKPQKTVAQALDNSVYTEDSLVGSALRGVTTSAIRLMNLADGASEMIGLDLVGDKYTQAGNDALEVFEKQKEKASNQGNWSDVTPQRLEEKKKLQEQSQNANGLMENIGAGIDQMVDVATNPNEWTGQGAVEMLTDPLNALSFGAGSLASKFGRTLVQKGFIGAGAGTIEGATINSGSEYIIAKGQGKSDEEASKIAIQSAGGGAMAGAGFGGAGGMITSKPKSNGETSTGDVIPQERGQSSESSINNVNETVSSNPLMTTSQIQEKMAETSNFNSLEKVKIIDTAEQESKQMHEQTKVQLEEAIANGASLEDMIVIRDNVEVTQAEQQVTSIINDGETPSPRLNGFRIINVIEDTITNSDMTPDDVFTKLRSENVKQELAKVASQAYKEKNTDILQDYISNKLATHLEVENQTLLNDIQVKAQQYNLEKIADEKAWSVSPTKKTIDDLIANDIGEDFVNDSQKQMIYELNKIGLVEDISVDNIKQKLNTNIPKGVTGVYNTKNKDITVDNTTSKIDRMQILTHEYIHGASVKLLELDKQFKSDITSLMNGAKKQTKNKEQYGFTNVDEFVSEAFSNPVFAKELNDMKLTVKLKEKYAVSDNIQSVWDLVVDQFQKVVSLTTGKDFKINKDSYFESINDMFAKKIQELETIRSQRIMDESSLKNDHLANPKMLSDFEKLQLHPRYDELIDMRKDVSAKDSRSPNNRVQTRQVIKDNDKLGGEDRTKVVGAIDEKNYNHDFALTKQDIKAIEDGKITPELEQKLKDDLTVLDTHPDWSVPDDINMRLTKELMGDDYSSNKYVNKDGDIVENGKVLFSINKQDKTIDFKALDNFAQPIPKPKNVLNFVNDFKKPIKTAIGDLTIDVNYLLNKSLERDDGARIDFMNLVKPTLEEPAYIIKHKGTFNFIKPFINEKDKVKKFLSVVSDRDGYVKVVTAHKFSNTDIRNIVKNGEVIEDFVSGTTNLHQSQAKLNLKDSTVGSSLDKSIPKDNTKSQGDNNGSTTDKKADTKNLEQSRKKRDSKSNNKSNKHRYSKKSSKDDRGDLGSNNGDARLSTKHKSMEEQPTSKDISTVISEFDNDKVVQSKDSKTFKEIKFHKTQEDSLGADTVSVADIETIPSSKFSTTKASKQKSYHPLKQTMSIGYGDRIVGVQKQDSNILVGRDKNKQYFTVSKDIVIDRLKRDTSILFHKKQEDSLSAMSSIGKKYNDGVDNIIDVGYDKLFGLGEKFVTPAKNVLDGMGVKGAKNAKWFEITKLQKELNEVINDFKIGKAKVYDEANNIKTALDGLSKEDSKNLLKVMNGDMDLKDLRGDLHTTYNIFRNQIDQNANELVDLGLLSADDKIENYVKRYYEDYIKENETVYSSAGVAYDKFKKRKDLSYDERVKLGMVEDSSFVISNTIAEQNILMQKAKVLQSLADEFGVDEANAPDNYVKISDETVKHGVKKWGALAGKYVPKELKQELNQARMISGEFRAWEDGLYPIVDHLKVNMTVKNPATHIYNIASNLLLSFLNGDMYHVAKVMHMRSNKPDEFKALVQKANDHGLNSYLDDFETAQTFTSKNGKKAGIMQTIFKELYMAQDSNSGQAMRKLYDWEDKIFKVAGFKKLLDQGMEEKSAYKQAVEVYVDYSTPLPSALRFVDKGGLMPFLHYQYKATPAVAKVIMKNPIKSLILGTGIASIGGLRGQNEDEKYMKPEWMEDKLLNMFYTKEWVRLGNGYYFNAGRMIPGTKLDFDFGGFWTGGMYIIDNKTPLGYSISNKYDNEMEKYAKQVLVSMESYLPSITFGRYGQRLTKQALGEAGIIEEPINRVTKKPDTTGAIVQRALGIREVNEKKELKSKLKKAKNARKYHDKKDGATYKDKKDNEKEYNSNARRIKKAGKKVGFNLDANDKVKDPRFDF